MDFTVENHGSIVLLRPHSDAAREWAKEHLPHDVMTFGHAFVVEPRYLDDLVAGIQNDGLVVS